MTRDLDGPPRPSPVLLVGLAVLTGCGITVNLGQLSTDTVMSSGSTGDDTDPSGPTSSSASSSSTSSTAVTITLSETAATLPPAGWRAFVATVENATDGQVTWSLDPPFGSGVYDVQGALGTVRYDAPATPGAYQLIATSDEDPTVSAAVTVTVSASAPIEVALFDNWNGGSVESGPLDATTFTVNETRHITYLDTFHFFIGNEPRGTIALRHSDDTLYGPWPVIGLDASGTINGRWACYPDVDIKPGTYTVVDSNPETWSMNSTSNFRGFARVHALPIP